MAMGILAGVLSGISYLLYCLRAQKPNPLGWFIWSLAAGLTLVSYWRYGGVTMETVWLPLSNALGTIVVTVVAFKRNKDKWEIGRFDLLCLAMAILSVVPWVLWQLPLATLLINLFIDALGALLLIRKSYLDPKSESLTAWSVKLIAGSLMLLAVKEWRFDVVIVPVYLCTIISLINVSLWLGWLRERRFI